MRAEIVITNIPQALIVPLQAVTTRKGKVVVLTRKGGESEPVPVEVGLFNTKFIEVTSGLKEGDEVLLSPPYDVSEKDLGGAIIGEEDEIPKPRPDLINRPPDNGGAPNQQRPPASDGPRDQRSVPRENGERPGRSGPAQGASDRKGGGERPGFNREEMMKRFDKNGDGQLDETEKAAMKEAFGGRGSKNRSSENRPE